MQCFRGQLQIDGRGISKPEGHLDELVLAKGGGKSRQLLISLPDGDGMEGTSAIEAINLRHNQPNLPSGLLWGRGPRVMTTESWPPPLSLG